MKKKIIVLGIIISIIFIGYFLYNRPGIADNNSNTVGHLDCDAIRDRWIDPNCVNDSIVYVGDTQENTSYAVSGAIEINDSGSAVFRDDK